MIFVQACLDRFGYYKIGSESFSNKIIKTINIKHQNAFIMHCNENYYIIINKKGIKNALSLLQAERNILNLKLKELNCHIEQLSNYIFE